MDLHLEPAWKLSLPDLADLLNRAYSGYFVPIAFTPSTLARMLRVQGIDLDTSQVAYREGALVGVALLAHRGWNTRLAAMGIVSGSRHGGIGGWLLDQILAAGRRRGDHSFTLEVIQTNTPAVRLYQSTGFATRRRLVGYRCDQPRGNASRPAEEVDVLEVARVLLREEPADLPWQVSGETLARMGPPVRGFRLGDAFAVIEPREGLVELLGLVVPPNARRRGAATRLLEALMCQYPGATWKVAARFPEEVPSALFTRLGFVQEPMYQLQMFCPVS